MPIIIDSDDEEIPKRTHRSEVRLQVGRNNGHDEDDDDDEFEDANSGAMEDDDFCVGNNSRRLQPLIPDDYGDEALAGIKFAEEFGNRYGTPHPNFFPGSLSDAIKESCMQPAKEVSI